MKPFSFLFLLIISLNSVLAQVTPPGRSALNPALFPFYHGVASGDPLADRVMLWSRITLDPPVSPVSVNWEIATDTGFTNVVNNGTIYSDSSKDYTIKIDAVGLQQNTWYYYRFSYDTFKSVTGRTRTLPTGSITNLRFAVASCQDYQKGYYNAHRHLSQRNDIDAVLFLGDYTYENGLDSIVNGRYHEPANKTIQLSEYRIRQSLYKLDPDLQEAHRQYPWIAVWDDHETANNAYTNGAKNHDTISDGSWYNRKVNGVITYDQWMPVRVPDPNDTFKIFRKFTWGNLADLNILDTRLYDRDKQVVIPGSQFVSTTDTTLLDSTRTMVGPEQFNWLENSLDSSQAQWQIIGQQVIMTPLVLPAGFQPTPVIINSDQWDGYPYERQKFYDHVISHNIQNVVVLTGDIHTAWANDLPLAGYDSLNRQNSVGVEFVAASISSSNDKIPPIVNQSFIYSLAQHVRYVELVLHGYYVLDITPARAQADFVYVSNVLTKNFTVSDGESWYVNSGERFLRKTSLPSVASNAYPVLAPVTVQNTSAKTPADNITTISMYPNPFISEVLIQFNTMKPEEIILEVFNQNGLRVLMKNLGLSSKGLNHATFDGNSLTRGFYIVELKGKSHSKGTGVIKIN